MRSRLDLLEGQLRKAQELEYIAHIEFRINSVTIHFAPHVLYKTIHELVKYINSEYKDVAWVPGSLYLVNPRKRITIHYKRDHS